jgi:hypothetical protein
VDYKRNRSRRRWRQRWGPAKKFRGDDQFVHPFPPYLVRAMGAYIEADGVSPQRRSTNNIEREN